MIIAKGPAYCCRMVDAVGAHLVATGAAMAPLPSSTLPVLAFDRYAEGEGGVAGLLDFPVPGGGFAVTPPS
jgi:hypothetical protein